MRIIWKSSTYIKNNKPINCFFPFAVRKQEALLTKENIIKLAIDCEQKISQVYHVSNCQYQQQTFLITHYLQMWEIHRCCKWMNCSCYISWRKWSIFRRQRKGWVGKRMRSEYQEKARYTLRYLYIFSYLNQNVPLYFYQKNYDFQFKYWKLALWW